MTAQAFMLDYSNGGIVGRCDVAYHPDRHVVIVTERPDNPGPSCTNAIEAIANALEHELGETLGPFGLAGAATLIEHNPHKRPHSKRCPSFDVVRFGTRDHAGRLMSPWWAPLARFADLAWVAQPEVRA